MNIVTAWRTDEPCPTCGKDLTLLEDGESPVRWECRSRGDSPTHLDSIAGGDW